MKTTELTFKVTVDENNLPLNIQWEAPGSGEKSECKSVMIALWDSKENNTLRIDLWTKDMMVDEILSPEHHDPYRHLYPCYRRRKNGRTDQGHFERYWKEQRGFKVAVSRDSEAVGPRKKTKIHISVFSVLAEIF